VVLKSHSFASLRTVERQVKVLIKNLAIFFLFSSKEFLPISFKIQLLETSPQNQKDQRQKQLGADKLVTTQIWKLKNLMSLFSDFVFIPVHFELFAKCT
jgi:hypothetical protein